MAEPAVITTTDCKQKLRGLIYTLCMITSAFFGTVYILMLILPSGLMEYIFGPEIIVKGVPIDHKRPGLIIMNHRTRLDWLFLWNALFRIDPWLLTTNKISLKGVLRFLPGAGFAMAANAFFFLYRKFDLDKQRIEKLIEYFANFGQKYQILLFPEGTDKCPLATGRSKVYAEKNSLVHYDYVLHPRVTGFVHFLKEMRKHDYVDYIYDCTVAYPEDIVQSELDLFLLGASPTKIHFDIRKINIKDLPTDDVELGKWLTDLWIEKEERLRRFYSKPMAERSLDSLPGDVEFCLTPKTKLVQALMISCWSLMTFIWLYVFFTVSYQSWLALLTMVFFYGCRYFYDGMELLLASQARQPALARFFGDEHTVKKVE